MRRIFLLLTGHEIESLPIWREHRRILRPVLCTDQRVGKDLMTCRMIYQDIRREIEHLYTILVGDMEALTCLVGGEGAILA